MSVKEFGIKTLMVTTSVFFLLYCFFPRYQFFDAKHRCNIISGKSEYYNDAYYARYWSE